jgi:hypothetical protein
MPRRFGAASVRIRRGRARDPGIVERPGDPGYAVPGQPPHEHPTHHRRCGRIRLQAVRPPSPRRVRLVRMRTGIREAYPYGGRPPRYRPCSRVCAAIAVRTQIQVSSVAVYPVMYRYIRTGYLRCQMPCPPEPGSFADQDDRLAFRPAGPGEKARDICEPDCRDRRRRIAPRHDPVRQAREEFGCHA